MASFGKLCSHVLRNLFHVYCTSFYGSQTWSLNSKYLKSLYTAYNKGLRRVLRLPYNSHTKVLYEVGNIPSLKDVLIKRFIKMYFTMYNSNNECIRYIAHCAYDDSLSFLGGNLNVIADCMGKKPRNIHEMSAAYACIYKQRDMCYLNSYIVDECIAIRDGHLCMDNFEKDMMDIIDYWSTCELTINQHQ